jgi:hypothetical protein
MMSVGEVYMKERILLTRTEYSVLKEKMKEHQCGWSKGIVLDSGRVNFCARMTLLCLVTKMHMI